MALKLRLQAPIWQALLVLPVLASCGGATPPPAAGESVGMVPDLRGSKVMVFPLQSAQGFDRTSFEPELTFALDQYGNGIEWVVPEDLRRIQRRTPGLQMEVENLPVGVFLQTEVRRIGDPLYGFLRRLGAVADSDVALIPVGAGTGALPPNADETELSATLELAATLIHTRTGRVLWYGVVEGTGEGPADPRAHAAAAEALVRTVAPFGGSGVGP